MGQLIETTKGLLDEDTLQKSQTTKDVPCGTSVVDTWKQGAEIVKQNVAITVTPEAMKKLLGETGDVT